jgi:hypothetical protein
MTFTDDFDGLTRPEQIARVQAVAREHGDQLTDTEAAQALNLYATQVAYAAQVADDLEAVRAALARHQHKLTDKKGEFCAGCLYDWPCPDLVNRPDWQPEAGA